jgi:hypothetical protein
MLRGLLVILAEDLIIYKTCAQPVKRRLINYPSEKIKVRFCKKNTSQIGGECNKWK